VLRVPPAWAVLRVRRVPPEMRVPPELRVWPVLRVRQVLRAEATLLAMLVRALVAVRARPDTVGRRSLVIRMWTLALAGLVTRISPVGPR
jgi:hypothetical protein